jgi:hypothetical protein
MKTACFSVRYFSVKVAVCIKCCKSTCKLKLLLFIEILRKLKIYRVSSTRYGSLEHFFFSIGEYFLMLDTILINLQVLFSS